MNFAAHNLPALPDEFGLEEIDVLEVEADDGGAMLLLRVLWEREHGMVNLHVIASRGHESGNLTLVTCTSPDVWLMEAPLDLDTWVTRNRNVWERCQAEWTRYLEQREP